MNSMTPEDAAILAQQDMETLCQWWHELNGWRWPDEIPNPEPARHIPGGSRRGCLMMAIDEAVGHRAISHYGNVKRQRVFPPPMTEEEFNDFWRGCFEGHQPSRDRYERRMREQCREWQEKLSRGPS